MFVLIGNTLVSRQLLDFHKICDYGKCMGACCRGAGKGTPLLPADVERLMAGSNLSAEDFVDFSDGLRMRCRVGGDCLFLNGSICPHNSIKPLFCSLFPAVPVQGTPFQKLILSPYDHCVFRDFQGLYLETVADTVTALMDSSFRRSLEDYLGRELIVHEISGADW
ncbi:MAG: hypothetical protein CVV64_00745 [Candidatus Wallbacteria bacterium HGW-Wallbacteria-1]|uniref:YkgJ family cysteine cluster protein n=1 Tax=Candidatus Wallbacteria bacterium HGW-Wallbacteria-1 TaxID=2013854 RepID=A0A2N1PUH7_9BACT|nr:MAG: hypothetical protein CVV64_00745 [Candidatus Wallbacteria bacterium HGW-Wallbacteria-1]